jgi:hypothetical protein
MISSLCIWIVHSCKNLMKQAPALEANALQILNGCHTKQANSHVRNSNEFIYTSNNSYTTNYVGTPSKMAEAAVPLTCVR